VTHSPPPAGHNNPPEDDPLLLIQAEHDDTFAEVANWLDGSKVENAEQMAAVDALLASVKAAKKQAEDAKEAEYRPHKAACDNVVARWKAFLADLDRQSKGLVAAVDAFKRAEAARLEAIRVAAARKAWEDTEAARKAAEAAAPTDLEAHREADAARERAEASQREANAAKRTTVKGMVTVQRHEVTDYSALLRWMNKDEEGRAALEACALEFVRTHSVPEGNGARYFQEKIAR